MNIAAKFLAVQNELNLKLSPEWAEKGWAYPDAMFTEATEAYNHLNWEWWRATGRTIDWDQVKLEWVDVGHFLFSEVIAQAEENFFDYMVKETLDSQGIIQPGGDIDVEGLKGGIKEFIKELLKYDSQEEAGLDFVLEWFFTVMHDLGLTVEQYYTLFIGKVCLNQLRWKNGYKKGVYNPSSPNEEHYVKTWNGVEDNVWLAEYAATLDPNADDFKEQLLAALEAKYAEVYRTTWEIREFDDVVQ